MRKKHFFQAKYNWSEEEITNFIDKHFLKIFETCNFKSGAVEVINLLKKDGHELLVISSRGGRIKEMKDIAERRLEEKGLKFDKYFLL